MEEHISNPRSFTCVSTAPSSPGRNSCSNIASEDFYFSEPTSPTHSVLKPGLQISNSARDLQRTLVPFNLNLEDKNNDGRIASLGGQKIPLEKEIIYNNNGGVDDRGAGSFRLNNNNNNSFEFEFSARFSEVECDSVSAEELFCNGQIRPLASLPHRLIQPTQSFGSTVADADAGKPFGSTVGGDSNSGDSLRLPVGGPSGDSISRRRDCNGPSARPGTGKGLQNPEISENGNFSRREDRDRDIRSQKGRPPLRNFLFEERKQCDSGVPEEESGGLKNLPDGKRMPKDSESFMKSRSTRSSKRWSLKDFLYRSASEGRGDGKDRLWVLSLIIPPAKQAQKHSMKTVSKQSEKFQPDCSPPSKPREDITTDGAVKELCEDEKKVKLAEFMKIPTRSKNGYDYSKIGRRVPMSAHELHYKANRAHGDELRKKSYLPYRQGLFGCLGFSTNTYTTMTGLTRSLHPFS